MEENTVLYDKQLKFEGNAYLDPKHMPVESYSALTQISRSEVFDGLRVTVLSDETVNGEATRYEFRNEEWHLISLTSEILPDEDEIPD